MSSVSETGLGWRDLTLRFREGRDGRAPTLTFPDFGVPSGTALAITGPSGCGKSSLLNLIAGLALPTGGEIRWQGQTISALGETARDTWRRISLGFVFQDFHLIPEMGALANILLPASFGPTPDRAAREAEARALCARFGLADLVRPAGTLSRGEQQRVAVARALAHRPALILADEPTASLDAENGAAVGTALVTEAAAIGATLICVTHDPALLARFETRLALMPPAGRVP
ncbi:MAG: hypothetical protein CFE31_04075 [Rhizobiales bacterium PAR1]|nr:MAG: hypothetical protein CFE31_04075 [Rhizobiales bacterium PAR1]